MVISVSRRTDIPNYYSEWFFNRVREGFVEVKNPMYLEQKSKIELSPDNVDCFVFWTKNPKNMLTRLDELKDYNYYYQFTLNGYGTEMEPGLPEKTKVLDTFIKLSNKIGKEKVIWRYDPILLSEKYNIDFHIETFSKFAKNLKGCTDLVVISFIDLYGHAKKNMSPFGVTEMSEEDTRYIARAFSEIVHENQMKVVTCAEKIDLSEEGIEHGHCIDQNLIERIIGRKLKGGKDKGQRPECGCFQSRDIGVYNTCQNGCKYCYANYSDKDVRNSEALYDIDSATLC